VTGKEFKLVLDCIECEGFNYTFTGYSDFKDIKDEEFHRLRRRYLEAEEELAEYVGYDDL